MCNARSCSSVRRASSRLGIGSGRARLSQSSASDDGGAPYYWERWTRYEGGACGGGGGGQVPATVALRASLVAQEEVAQGAHATAATLVARDALLVVAGDHFNYVVQRPVPWERLAPLGGVSPLPTRTWESVFSLCRFARFALFMPVTTGRIHY